MQKTNKGRRKWVSDNGVSNWEATTEGDSP